MWPTCNNHSRHRHAWRFYRTDGPDNATGQRRPAKQYSLILWIASIGCPLSPRDWGALGFLSSFPAIRLREDYLGMLLLGSAQLFQIFLGGTRDLVGGSAGIQVPDVFKWARSEEHTSELQSLAYLVCRLLLEKKKKKPDKNIWRLSREQLRVGLWHEIATVST